MRPWTGARSRGARISPASFNGATALRPWTGCRLRAAVAVVRGFNGATALRPWTARNREHCQRRLYASMGPRPCGRGRKNEGLRNLLGDVLQWGHGLAAVDGRTGRMRRRRPTGFNGATALRPWTASSRLSSCARASSLQWGHGLAAVDGSQPWSAPSRVWGFNGATALRPWTERIDCPAELGGCGLQWGHGLAAVDGIRHATAPYPSIGFNGATALRPWTAGRRRLPMRFPKASMGPRPCGRGRSRPHLLRVGAHGLQWGHGLAAVDGEGAGGVVVVRGVASMGPRPCGRGRAMPDGNIRRWI